jgi:hypothetical protein
LIDSEYWKASHLKDRAPFFIVSVLAFPAAEVVSCGIAQNLWVVRLKAVIPVYHNGDKYNYFLFSVFLLNFVGRE